MKRTKNFRGQKAYRKGLRSPCGCFYCTGLSKPERYHRLSKLQIKEAKKEILEISND